MIVTVFDWDDTLMSTTDYFRREAISERTSGDGEDSPDSSPTLSIKYPALTKRIRALLSAALSKGHVYIITNGEIGWVYKCIDENLVDEETGQPPRDLLERVHLLSTVDCGIARDTDVENRKTAALSRIGGMFNRRGAPHRLVAFGDCVYDREGVLMLKYKISKYTYVTNVKMMSRPDVHTLLAQQELLLKNFNGFYSGKHHDVMTAMVYDQSSGSGNLGNIVWALAPYEEDEECSEYREVTDDGSYGDLDPDSILNMTGGGPWDIQTVVAEVVERLVFTVEDMNEEISG